METLRLVRKRERGIYQDISQDADARGGGRQSAFGRIDIPVNNAGIVFPDALTAPRRRLRSHRGGEPEDLLGFEHVIEMRNRWRVCQQRLVVAIKGVRSRGLRLQGGL
jgi:NAD(P)-dependent dehydrogenase (short-subunit alcohol dehydrogenase family)